ncbi:TraR/DksA C4-type zinc finger protein [Acinetobacter sp. ME22]|uniref:TraR/DksA C4-type zinc finger protein n=1 Tax=Acinetobacter sp. ME22 TaxID=2904802 RepID=UPI002ED01399
MSDDADFASERDEQMLASIIGHRQQFTGVSLHECEECGDIIPEQRRKLGGVKYCIKCQSYFETKAK